MSILTLDSICASTWKCTRDFANGGTRSTRMKWRSVRTDPRTNSLLHPGYGVNKQRISSGPISITSRKSAWQIGSYPIKLEQGICTHTWPGNLPLPEKVAVVYDLLEKKWSQKKQTDLRLSSNPYQQPCFLLGIKTLFPL